MVLGGCSLFGMRHGAPVYPYACAVSHQSLVEDSRYLRGLEVLTSVGFKACMMAYDVAPSKRERLQVRA